MTQLNFSPFPVLYTERLVLRQLSLNDANEVFFLRSDPEVNKFVDRPRAQSLQDAKAFIGKINSGIAKGEWIFWAISLNQDKRLIGTITLWNIRKEEAKGEIGYELMPAYQGKGMMQEAMSKVLEFGFDIMKLNLIEAFTHSGNERSSKLLEKNRFRKDTELENSFKGKEEYRNLVIYTLQTWNS